MILIAVASRAEPSNTSVNQEMIVKKMEELPSGAGEVARAYPAVWEAYAALGKATGGIQETG